MDPLKKDQHGPQKNLLLLEYYKVFDNYDDKITNDNNICENIFANKYSSKNESIKLCRKLSNILTDLRNKKPEDGKYTYKYCSYLNYWLRDQLTQITFSPNDDHDVYMAFQEVYKKFKPALHCYIHSYNEYANDEFEIIKKLHDYSETFKNIQYIVNNTVNKTQQEKQQYCSFIANGVNYYNNIIDNYRNSRKSQDYFKQLKIFKRNLDNFALSSLTCSTPMPVARPIENVSYSTSKHLSINLLTLFGIFLTFFCFYKFTPFGCWINGKLGIRRKKRFRNIEGTYQQEFMQDQYDSDYETSDYEFSDDSSCYTSYGSLRNL
ncbi:variable surface protein [Plasmodium gonderi]|uniref:Variable surface protein n=1 Tax=Plasmodium gonderi TaxID=77519 RepID=A0A1Y1JHI7_PLAGO|nr:variable surface protein [Plasmodium gonderi]GAW80805.1 variable surface protein [Plasmodium gonderi]